MNRIRLMAVILLILSGSLFTFKINCVTAETNTPFMVSVSETPTSIDPLQAVDSTSVNVIMQVCEGLYAYNLSSPEMEVIPQLAKSLGTWSPDLRILTIELKKDVIFHDGTPFDAYAAKWNFDRIFALTMSRQNPHYPLYLNDEGDSIIEQTEVVDDSTIRFVLRKPWVVWEKLLAFSASFMIKPNFVLKTRSLTILEGLIGTGPFKIEELDQDYRTVFGVNENYHRGASNIKKMIFQAISDDDFRSMALLNHEIHYGGFLPEYTTDVDLDPYLTRVKVHTGIVRFLQMNMVTMSWEIRRACQFALNYSYWIKFIRHDLASEIYSPIPDGMQYHDDPFENFPCYNVMKAREYIFTDLIVNPKAIAQGLSINNSTADWRSIAFGSNPLLEINFTRYLSHTTNELKSLLADNYADIGIKINDHILPYYIDWNNWYSYPANRSQLQLSLASFSPKFPDPICMIQPIFETNASLNYMGVADLELDAMIDASYTTIGEDRRALFDNMQIKIIVELAAVTYLSQDFTYFAYNKLYVRHSDDIKNFLNIWYFYDFIFTDIDEEIDLSYFSWWDLGLSLSFIIFWLCFVIISIACFDRIQNKIQRAKK